MIVYYYSVTLQEMSTSSHSMVPLATIESLPSDPPPPPTSGKPSITDTSKGYSSVNKLSLLPDEVRTVTNMEGETMSQEKEAELMQQYVKERDDYEKKQLQKMLEMRAKRGNVEPQAASTAVPPLSTTPPRGGSYDTISPLPNSKGVAAARVGPDPYEDPADAVAGPKKLSTAKKPSESPTQQKKMSMGTAGALEYTPVFNTLPEGQVEKIHIQGYGKSGRCLSDSSPTTKSPHSTTKAAPLSASYENSPFPSPSKANNQESPRSPTGGEAPVANDSSPENMQRQDSARHSNRKPAKEVVEFDPNKPRKFRVTSTVNKKLTNGEKMEEVDGNLKESQSEATGGARSKSFSVQVTAATEDQSYALVNMVDKKKNRVENNVVKVEGSGVPQRYRVPISTTS